MKKVILHIIRPFLIIIIMALIFSFITATTDFTKWDTGYRIAYVFSLFVAFILTDND